METRASLAFFATPGKLRMSPTSQTEQKLSRNEVARTPSWCKNIKVSFHSSLALLVNLQFGCSARHSYHVACNFKSKREAPKDYGRIYFLKKSILYIYTLNINKSWPISMGRMGSMISARKVEGLTGEGKWKTSAEFRWISTFERPGACWLACPLSKSSQVGSWRKSGPHRCQSHPSKNFWDGYQHGEIARKL